MKTVQTVQKFLSALIFSSLATTENTRNTNM